MNQVLSREFLYAVGKSISFAILIGAAFFAFALPQAVHAAAPAVTLSASPTSIRAGQSSTLTWVSTGATSCKALGFTASGKSGSATIAPLTTTTYYIVCKGPGGSNSAQVTVTVVKPPVTLTLQTQNNLAAVGIVGPQTRDLLLRLLGL